MNSINSPSTGLPQEGFVRLPDFAGGPGKAVPVSKSTVWAKVKKGEFPKPLALGPRITAWRVEDIRAWIEAQEKPNQTATPRPQ